MKRKTIVLIILSLLTVGAFFFALSTGSSGLSISGVFSGLFAQDYDAYHIIYDIRLPRALCALGVGAALGVAGSMFQSLSRNPLGSPDVVGFTAGSTSGALIGIIVFSAGSFQTAIFSVLGGLVTAGLVYLLVSGRGVNTGLLFVLVGIGVSALLTSVNGFLITRAALGDAIAAQTWLVGNLNARAWEHVVPLFLALLVLLPLAFLLAQSQAILELGDATAAGLGVRVGPVRLTVVLVATALAAVATAAAGPVAFVALAAGNVAKQLIAKPGPQPLGAALTGATLLLFSDVFAVRGIFGVSMPVGIATGMFGGLYLCFLLLRSRSLKA